MRSVLIPAVVIFVIVGLSILCASVLKKSKDKAQQDMTRAHEDRSGRRRPGVTIEVPGGGWVWRPVFTEEENAQFHAAWTRQQDEESFQRIMKEKTLSIEEIKAEIALLAKQTAELKARLKAEIEASVRISASIDASLGDKILEKKTE